MLRDLGSLVDFGPSDLTEEDYEIIENADYVCLFNWAGTRKHGTSLAEAVFNEQKRKANAKHISTLQIQLQTKKKFQY